MKKTTFEELGLSVNTKKAIADMGFIEATPIQAESIPVLMSGRDMIGQARTGTGKTAAFAIPVIERIDMANKSLQALVICPTRELAMQVTEEFRKLYKYFYGLSVVPVYGGQDMGKQLSAISRKPQIIVGTPGRIIDHMRRGSIKLDTVRFVILDEADEMLNMGFRNDMETILGQTPKTRQTIMFSATMNKDIMKLMQGYQNRPVSIDTSDHKLSAPKIEQTYCDILDGEKQDALTRILDHYELGTALVFANARSRVDRIVRKLKAAGYEAAGIHGGLEQRRRERVMGSFREGTVGILVATDVAGRGIDVSGIEAVINFDLPKDDEDYVHRIGRTGRAGKCGRSFTFVVGPERGNLMRIERTEGLRIERISVPPAKAGRPVAAPAPVPHSERETRRSRPETVSHNDNFRREERPAERRFENASERPSTTPARRGFVSNRRHLSASTGIKSINYRSASF